MPKQVRAKQERIVEAVRHGLEGEAAAEFIRQSGYAMTVAGIARHLRSMGGRGHVQELINAGKTNNEIMCICFPDVSPDDLPVEPPSQGELFEQELKMHVALANDEGGVPLYETTKVSFRAPADLYEAIRIAAKAEHKTQSQLIVDILTEALSKMPRIPKDE